MEKHSLYTHYLSCWIGVPDRELSENTKKIIALVESEYFLESNKYTLSDAWALWKIVYSARADVHYKLELLDGIMEEFKDDKQWEEYERGKMFMEYYEPFRLAVDLMKSADNVFFTLTKVTRDENNKRFYDDNYPEFSSVDEISKYLESNFDEKKDSEDDPEWYIVHRHDKNIKTPSLYEYHAEWNRRKKCEYFIKTSAKYLLSKRGTVWKCGIEKNDFFEGDIIGDEICSAPSIADYVDIIVSDGRPFQKIVHVIYDGEEDGLYVEDGKLKLFPIENHVAEFEEFAFELRLYIQEDMSKLSEQKRVLQLIQQKYRSMNWKDGYKFLGAVFEDYWRNAIDGIPVEMVKEKFLK